MAQDIVVRYRLELDEALKKLDAFAKELEQTDKSASKSAKSLDKTADSADKLGNEVSQASKQIKDSTKNVDDFSKKGNDTFTKLQGSVKSFALGAGAAIAAAFSVDAIIQFGKASIDAFLQAEKNAERLKFAITTIGGESEAAFQRLIDQSEELQKITVFDDDSIQQAQAALAAFGLTADEIENIIPKLADFATVAGTDLNTAVSQLGAGLEGAGREFKKYGIEVSATATRQQNLNTILQGFGRFAGAAEKATKTLTGRLEQQRNALGDLQERIGQQLAPAFIKLQTIGLRLVGVIANIFGAKAQSNIESTTERLTNVRGEFNVLIETLKRGNLTTEGRKQLIDEINEQYGEYLPNLLTEKSSLEEIEKAQAAVNKQVEERILLLQLEKDIEQILKNTIAAQKDLIEVEKERIRLQNDLSDSSTSLATKREQLNQREALANAIIEDGRKRIDALKNSYAELGARLGITSKQIKDTATALGAASDVRIPGSAEEIKQIETLTAAYKDLFSAQNLTPEQKFQDSLLEILVNAKTFDDIKTQFAEFAAKNKVEIPTTLEIPPNRQIVQTVSETADVVTQTWIEKNGEILQSTSQLLSEISSVYTAFTNRQIEEINREKDARISAINESLIQNEDALEKRQISEQDAATNEKRLIEQQTRAEETAARKERELKRKQAIADKAAALVQIAINTAIGISRAYSDTGPIAGNAFAALIAALGAAQAATVAAQPIPYAKGTKKAKGGLARVGEEGEEIMYVPNGTKVLPNKQTNRYGEVLDAMFDNRFDEYVNRRYIAPALMKEKARRETNQQRSFAENIVQSAMVNPQTGLTYYDMEQIRKKGTRLTDDTIERLADALNRRTGTTRFK